MPPQTKPLTQPKPRKVAVKAAKKSIKSQQRRAVATIKKKKPTIAQNNTLGHNDLSNITTRTTTAPINSLHNIKLNKLSRRRFATSVSDHSQTIDPYNTFAKKPNTNIDPHSAPSASQFQTPLTQEELDTRMKAQAPLLEGKTKLAQKILTKMNENLEITSKLRLHDDKGNPIDIFSDPKSPHFIPGPKIDDDGSPYSLATRSDNVEYARQMTILNNFQSKLSNLTNFMNPFADQHKKVKDPMPTTIGEMNSMLQHAILTENNYELAFTRFSRMITTVPDSLKSWLELSLFDQFNQPTLFRRDNDVNSAELNEKVFFQPDQRAYQLIIVAALQAMEQIKHQYHPGMVGAAMKLVKSGIHTNSQNDDEQDTQAVLMFRQIEEIMREIKRRKELPLDEQNRLLSLENGGLGHTGQDDETALVANNVGLHKALNTLRSTDMELSNKHQYSDLGITQYELEVQKREKLLGQNQTIIDMLDSPDAPQFAKNGLKYKANRKISADDSDDYSEDVSNNQDNGNDEVNQQKKQTVTAKSTDNNNNNNNTETATAETTSTLSNDQIKHNYGKPILSAWRYKSGKLVYKISLPQLPFSITEGDELDHWCEKLKGIAGVALEASQELQELKQEMLKDPFSEPYHCYKQTQTWHARMNFVLRNILEHYYALIHEQNPQLYDLLTQNTNKMPGLNQSGWRPLHDSIGHDTSLLDTVIATARDQGLDYIWLEATTLKQKLTPAPKHVPTITERQIMAKENYLKEMIFDDVIKNVPTCDFDGDNYKVNQQSDADAATTAATAAPPKQPVPKLTTSQFTRCLNLFDDYAQQVQSYVNAVRNYDNNFLLNIDLAKHKEKFEQNAPEKMSFADYTKEADEHKRKQDEAKKEQLHEKIRKEHGENEFNSPSYTSPSDDNSTHPKRATFQSLSPEQIEEFKAKRPQPLPEMLQMDRIVAETVRRYPLLASLVPQTSSHYKSFMDIVKKHYIPQSGDKNNTNIDDDNNVEKVLKMSKLPFQFKNNTKIALQGLPLSPVNIMVHEWGFDTIEKVNAFPYPQIVKDKINNMSVTMVKVPVLNPILNPADDIQVNNERGNYKHLLLSPATSLTTLDDAIQFINKFTQMGKMVQNTEIESGELEEVNEFAYQLDYQSFLQSKYNKAVKITQIQNNSINIRNMSRLGLFYLDTMIISWAAQQNLPLPQSYVNLVQDSYSELTNDVFNQDVNMSMKSKDDNDDDGSTNDKNDPKKAKKSATTTTTTSECQSLVHDISITNPVRSRIEQWRERNLHDQLTNPTKFYALPIDDRVELIDKTNETDKAKNTLALFFQPDPSTPLDDQQQKYHLLRSYLRFAMRAGDHHSLEKALTLYRASTRLLEYVQRRTNEDVYIDGGELMYKDVKTEEDFDKVTQEFEQNKLRQQQINDEVPNAMQADMTKDDISKSTKNMGPKSEMWDHWFASDLPKKSGPFEKLANDPRNRADDESVDPRDEQEIHDLMVKSGMLDDYVERIDALLSAKHTSKKKVVLNDVSDTTGDNNDSNVENTKTPQQMDEDDVQFYKRMVGKTGSKELGSLYVPGYDESDSEDANDIDAALNEAGIKTTGTDGAAASTDATKTKPRKTTSQIGQDGRMIFNHDDDDDDDGDGDDPSNSAARAEREERKKLIDKHAPHTRLAKLATASHTPHDYMLTQMVVNFHQFLIRNQSTMHRVGLPLDVTSKRFSDEVTAHWALARRKLYDNRIKRIHSFDVKINPETGIEYTTLELREKQKDKAKFAVKMLKKNRPESSLEPFEREAGQLAIMTMDTLILEGYIPVAKITAKQAYDDGLLSKEFIDDFFEKHGPDLEDSTVDPIFNNV